MWNETRFSRQVGVAYPIVQGPFGGGPSSVRLVAAVSNAGGVGSYGMHMLAPQRMREVISQIREATDKPFAVNLWMPRGEEFTQGDRAAFDLGGTLLEPYFSELGLELPEPPVNYLPSLDEQVEAILETKPPIFSFAFGAPGPEVIEACRSRGIVTLGTATTPQEAVSLQESGVDCVVASGMEAGGHRSSFLKRPEESLVGMLALLPQVADLITLPFIAAGGIADARGIAAAFALGAHGVQIGSAFLACEESDASSEHRAALDAATASQTVLSRAFTGRLARMVRNTLAIELDPQEECIPPYPIQSWLLAQLRAAAQAQGRSDLLALSAGQAAPLIRHRRAVDLMADLVHGVPRVIDALKT